MTQTIQYLINQVSKSTHWGFISRTQDHNSDLDITLKKIDTENKTYMYWDTEITLQKRNKKVDAEKKNVDCNEKENGKMKQTEQVIKAIKLTNTGTGSYW